jgi:hypothetical protein
MKHKIYIIGILFVIFYSCEGYRCASGTIYDKETLHPLDSVKCNNLTSGNISFSDSLGFYDICNHFGGCVPDCPDIIIEYSKEGYTTITIKNPLRDNIYLEKEN